MYNDLISFIKGLYPEKEIIPLHEPVFRGNEKKYVLDAIDSTFVSSVGAYVTKFEEMLAEITGAKHAIATVNGTSALHAALVLCGVERDDEVVTQPLTFVATANAIAYCGAKPVFIDVDIDTMGLSAVALKKFLEEKCQMKNGVCFNKQTNARVKACVPMHTFGHPCRIDEIVSLCHQWGIKVIEDAAESLGSTYKGQHTGTFGDVGIFSFNGNKIVTSGGGGAIVTNSQELAIRAKHITTTAKVPHKWEYVHDEIGFNYRMPNLNAALLVAQLEQLEKFLEKKRGLANKYIDLFSINLNLNLKFKAEPKNSKSNYWLNTIELGELACRNTFLSELNSNGIQVRPSWSLMNRLVAFRDCEKNSIDNSIYLESKLINLPSSVSWGVL